MSISPSCFGPPTWILLHMISFGYPEKIIDTQYYETYGMYGSDIKKNTYEFFRTLGAVIPCPHCREHYKTNFKGLDKNLDTRSKFTRWVYDLHNIVNHQNGVDEASIPSYFDVIKKYEQLLVKDCKNVCSGNNLYCEVVIKNKNGTSENFSEWKNYSVGTIGTHDVLYICIIIFLLFICLFLYFKISKNKR
jgi:hypothetical protein